MIGKLEKATETRALSPNELQIRSNGLHQLLVFEKMKVLDMKQKAKTKWVVDGDENSKIFHCFVNHSKKKNRISGLMINGNWSTSVKEIKDRTFRFFQEKIKDNWISHPKLVNSNIKSIDMMDTISLEAPFSLEEVKKAVYACGGDKAPGPDGLAFKFIKKYWPCISPDVMRFVQHFDEFGTLGRGCNSSCISFTPKVKDPTTLGDYRPISLIGCMYKIISKLLATRLKTMVGKVVGEVQSTYVEGRSILDGPLIVNDLCGWEKSIKKKILLFKVDFDKAFDSIN